MGIFSYFLLGWMGFSAVIGAITTVASKESSARAGSLIGAVFAVVTVAGVLLGWR